MTNTLIDPATVDWPQLGAGLPSNAPWAMLLRLGDTELLVEWVDGSLRHRVRSGINDRWDFSITLSAEQWASYLAPEPGLGFSSVGAMIATQGEAVVGGDRVAWARASGAVDRVVDAFRDLVAPRARNPYTPAITSGLSPISGAYVTVDVAGTNRRIYFESAGEGPVLLCLHTAGADSRQFRYMLEDSSLTSQYRVIAFDMPWHGRSDAPDDWERRPYRLTTREYVDTILAVMAALQLDRPILAGCSMGGAIGLYLASVHPELFSGVIAIEGGLGNPGRFVDWTRRADVDHSTFLASWEAGLIAPTSPAGPAAQTLWGYAQGGPGVYQGDTYFYSQDLPKVAADLQPAGCPLVVLSGEYDYSATTAMSHAAAVALGGELLVMKGMGHFPMSEDPERFAHYLRAALDKLESASPEVS